MQDKPVGYCVATYHGYRAGHVFTESYEDAVEALREFVMAYSNLLDGDILEMGYEELCDEIAEIDEWSEEEVWGYILPIRFEQD